MLQGTHGMAISSHPPSAVHNPPLPAYPRRSHAPPPHAHHLPHAGLPPHSPALQHTKAPAPRQAPAPPPDTPQLPQHAQQDSTGLISLQGPFPDTWQQQSLLHAHSPPPLTPHHFPASRETTASAHGPQNPHQEGLRLDSGLGEPGDPLTGPNPFWAESEAPAGPLGGGSCTKLPPGTDLDRTLAEYCARVECPPQLCQVGPEDARFHGTPAVGSLVQLSSIQVGQCFPYLPALRAVL